MSARQHRAMEAAAHGKSTIGIPASIGKEFSDADKGKRVAKDADPQVAAGVVFVSPDNCVLLLCRSQSEPNYGGYWSLPGGKGDAGETPMEAALREVSEEIGDGTKHAWVGEPTVVDERTTPTGLTFTTFAQPVRYKFTPELNAEHSGFVWSPLDELPTPLHPAVAETLRTKMGAAAATIASDSLIIALDKESVRDYDADGRLHVSATPISKANVCEYYGKEIPGAEGMGLEPMRKYRLLRHPEELEKAKDTFNHLPLLKRHVPVSADDHKPEDVIGSTGTDAAYDHPHLSNSLVVWSKPDIDDIESGKRKELSSAYRYRADMTPGTFEGESYDGVMRDIVGNHVALVKEGRAGPDVVVGDSKPKDVYAMAGKFAFDEGMVTTPNAGVPVMGGKFVQDSEHAEDCDCADCMAARDAAFGEAETAEADKGSKERSKQPADVFLQPPDKYPVKVERDGKWVYDKKLLEAAASRAAANGHDDLAKRAEAIRAREFDGANDSKPKEPNMAKVLTRKAVAAQGAIMAFLMPRLAEDAAIALDPIFIGVTAKNYATRRPGIVTKVTEATKDKLAEDQTLEGLSELLLAFDEFNPVDTPETGGGKGKGPAADKKAKDAAMKAAKDRKMSRDAANEGIKEMLKDKLSGDDYKAACDMLDDQDDDVEGEDAELEDKDSDPEGTNKAEDEEDKGMKKDDVNKAMDEALAGERAKQRGIREAERFVRPWVGNIDVDKMACDSAEDVYKNVLEGLGKKTKGIHPSAFKDILEMMPKPNAGKAPKGAQMATDSATVKGFAEFFPDAMKIGLNG